MLVTVATGLLTVLFLAAIGLGWRLSRGPIALDWLRPRLERALPASPGGPEIRIGSPALAWFDGRPEIRVDDVHVRTPDGNEFVVPAAVVTLAAGALLHGVVEVEGITLIGPRLAFAYEPGGSLAPAPTATPAARLGAALRTGALGSLDEVRIRDGSLEVRHAGSGVTWRARGVALRMRRTDTGIALAGGLLLEGGPHPARVTARGAWLGAGPQLQVGVRGLDPAALGSFAVEAALPVDAIASLSFDDALRLERARLRMRGGPGRIAWSGDVVPVDRLKLGVDARLDEGRIEVAPVRVRLDDGVEATGQARLDDVGGARTFEASLAVPAVPVRVVQAHWPPQVAAQVRRWVAQNISGGMARDGRLRVRGAPGHVETEASLRFADLTVRVADVLPPIRRVAGALRFSGGRFDASVTGATIGDVGVENGRVSIAGKPPILAVTADVRGALGAALAVLESPGLGVDLGLGVPSADVRGTVAGRVGLGFPLKRRPSGLAGLGLTVSATLDDLHVPRLAGGRDVDGGPVALTLEPTRLALDGPLRVAGVPIRASLEQDPRDGTSRRIVATGRLDRQASTALGWDLGERVTGTIDATLRLSRRTADVDADLREVALAVPGLQKAAGDPGSASAHLGLGAGPIPDVERFAIAVPSATLSGSARRSADGTRWDGIAARLAAVPANGGSAALTVEPGPPPQRFVLETADVGRFLQLLGRPGWRGGRFSVTGTVSPDDTGVPASARLEATDLVVRQAPLLARIATLASFTGLVRSLNGKGLVFTRISGQLAHRWPVITIADGLAEGREVALAVAGTIDVGSGGLDLRGTVVPSYFGLNTPGERVPVMGPVLGVVTGGAIQAVDFGVRGTLGTPDVTVSPLSALAPGRLRDVVRAWRGVR